MFTYPSIRLLLLLTALPLLPNLPLAAQSLPGNHAVRAGELTLQVEERNGRLGEIRVSDRDSGKTLEIPQPFSLVFHDGSTLDAGSLPATLLKDAKTVEDPHEALQRQNRVAIPEQRLCWSLTSTTPDAHLRWCLVAHPGTHYVRELLQIQAGAIDLPITEVRMLAFHDSEAHVDGVVKGSPIVDAQMFFGVEHPLSSSVVENGDVREFMPRTLPLKAGQSITYSAVVGAAPTGQMRRRFLEYLENERPRPYRAFLHYNTWFDLGYGNRFDEAGVLNRIHAFGEELTRKRGVELDSFLLDDGWDDTHNLWKLNPGFPDGLAAAEKAAQSYGANIGLWLSPWGGYDKEKLERVAYGKEHGYELLNNGYALSGPKYFKRFEDTCLEMMQKYDVNQFKFDGTGNADRVFPGSAFDSDFDAAIHLIERLRQQNPKLFVNLTTGTTASPFWVFYADSIWRGGEDHDFTGEGTARQRWITYRDAQTYANIVRKGPLFPLNSLMLHGIVYASQAKDVSTDPHDDFADEVHSYFATGTQTQELYITPSLLSSANWDTLAEAARWSRAHGDTLRDTHWIGGDPGQLQVYGWAAWSPKLGILTLRNPSHEAQTFVVDAEKVFELPQEAPARYQVRSVWQTKNQGVPSAEMKKGTPYVVQLAPFQVLTLEATPLQ